MLAGTWTGYYHHDDYSNADDGDDDGDYYDDYYEDKDDALGC